jgi:mannose-6-phosphate isomerase-like protein (cupin superfamily)
MLKTINDAEPTVDAIFEFLRFPCNAFCTQNNVMLQAGQELNLRPIGMVAQVTKTAAETEGQSFEMEWTLLPHQSGTPVHSHPTAEETYRVIEGVLEVKLNGHWQTLKQGETFTVPTGAAHTFRNPLSSITKVYNVHRPALNFDSYFSGLHRLVVKLAKDDAPLKPNLNVAIHLSMLMKEHPQEMQPVNPPPSVVSILSRIGKWRGMNT